MKGKIIKKVYFSTNLEREAGQLLEYYRLRFQMEYLFKDAKQHLGLKHCQARSKNKLDFLFNASLTALSIAKVISRNGHKNLIRIKVSISEMKSEMQNRNMISRVFSMYRIDRKLIKINNRYRDLLKFDKFAA